MIITGYMAARDLSMVLKPIDTVPLVPRPVDDDWIARARQRCIDLQIDHADLAAWIGSPPSGVSYLIGDKPTRQRSTYVEKISVALGIEMPLAAQLESLVERILANVDPRLHGPEVQALKLQLEMLVERLERKNEP